MKKVVFKDYLFLFIVLILTSISCFYILRLYKVYNDNLLSTPVITKHIKEITYDDLENFLKEREILFVYTCTTSNYKCRNFEEAFGKEIQKKDYKDEIVYINLGISYDENDLIKKIYNNYKDESLIKKTNSYQTIFLFKNGKIIDLISRKNYGLTIDNVINFLEGYDLQ